MATAQRYESKKYPNQVESQFVSNELNLIYEATKFRFSVVKPLELSLTPRYPSEDNCFIFTFLFSRHVLNQDDAKLVDIKIRYAYRLRLEDLTPTPEELFTLLDESSADFANFYYDKIKHVSFPENNIKKLVYEDIKDRLEGLIDFWNDSLRHLKVDKFGKPLE